MIRCEYFESAVCRSCTEIRVEYREQLCSKETEAHELLGTLGVQSEGVVWSPVVASVTEGFRNRAKMVVTGTIEKPRLGILGDGLAGVDLTACLLCSPGVRASFPAIAEFITRAKLPPYDVKARRGELKYVLVTAGEDDGLMIRFVLRTDEAVVRIRKHLGWLRDRLPAVRVVSANLQPLPSAIVEGEVEILLTDESALRMSFRRGPILLPPGAFFQTNSGVAEALYQLAATWSCEVAPSEVLDLYCGVGGFALHVGDALRGLVGPGLVGPGLDEGAGRSDRSRACRVRGVEIHADAVACAESSAALWGLSNIAFLAGDATVAFFPKSDDADSFALPEHLPSSSFPGTDRSSPLHAPARSSPIPVPIQSSPIPMPARSLSLPAGSTGLVIVNPPRRGLGAELAGRLEGSEVGHILYSSCNAESLVRDVRSLESFRVVRACVLDMFPHTRHYETLVQLLRR